MFSVPQTRLNLRRIPKGVFSRKCLTTTAQAPRTQEDSITSSSRNPSFYHFVHYTPHRQLTARSNGSSASHENDLVSKHKPPNGISTSQNQGDSLYSLRPGPVEPEATPASQARVHKRPDDGVLAQRTLAEVNQHGDTPLPSQLLDTYLNQLLTLDETDLVQRALSALYPSVMYQLHQLPLVEIAQQPAGFVSLAFKYLRYLMKTEPQHAIALFQVLVERQYIPPFVFLDERVGSLSVQNMIFSACIRAAVHWRWTSTASRFLEEFLKTEAYSPELIGDLIRDVVGVLIEDGSETSMASANDIIQTTQHSHPFNDLIARFYHKAASVKNVKEALSLYRFTRHANLASRDALPPPPNSVIPWLVESFDEHNLKDEFDDLVEDIIRRKPRIAPLAREPLIHTVLRRNLLPQTKALWDLYSQGPGGDTVRGSATLMLDIVYRFAPLGRRELAGVGTSSPTSSDGPSTLGPKPAAENFLQFAHAVWDAFSVAHRPLRWASEASVLAMAKGQFLLRSPAMGYTLHAKAMKKLSREISLEDIDLVRSPSFATNPGVEGAWVRQYVKAGGRISNSQWADLLYHVMVKGDTRSVRDLVMMYKAARVQVPFEAIQTLTRAALHGHPRHSQRETEKRLTSVADALETLRYPTSILARQRGVLATLVKTALDIQRPDLAFWFWHDIWSHACPTDRQEHGSLQTLLHAKLVEKGLMDDAKKLKALANDTRRKGRMQNGSGV